MKSHSKISDVIARARKAQQEHEQAHDVQLEMPTYVKCSNGCGADVEVLYPHELDSGVMCDDCFERLTTL